MILFIVVKENLNGFIYSHSKDFNKTLGYDHQSAENMNINYYLPDVVISELKINFIYETRLIESSNCEQASKIIGIVLKSLKINNIIIYVLFITDDIDQLNWWKSGKDFYDIEGANFIYSVNQDYKIEEEEKTEEKTEIITNNPSQLPDENNQKTHKEIIKDTQDKLKYESHSNFKNTLDNYELKAAKKSTTALKTIRVFLFVSVTDIQILIVVITNIIIVVYLTQEAIHAKNLQVINNLGELCFWFSRLALITRQFKHTTAKNSTDYDSVSDFQYIIDNIEIQQNNLLTDYDSWSGCKGSESINQDIIPYVTFANPYVIQHTNLYEFTEDIIDNVKNI